MGAVPGPGLSVPAHSTLSSIKTHSPLPCGDSWRPCVPSVPIHSSCPVGAAPGPVSPGDPDTQARCPVGTAPGPAFSLKPYSATVLWEEPQALFVPVPAYSPLPCESSSWPSCVSCGIACCPVGAASGPTLAGHRPGCSIWDRLSRGAQGELSTELRLPGAGSGAWGWVSQGGLGGGGRAGAGCRTERGFGHALGRWQQQQQQQAQEQQEV